LIAATQLKPAPQNFHFWSIAINQKPGQVSGFTSLSVSAKRTTPALSSHQFHFSSAAGHNPVCLAGMTGAV
jgi:hypothetical protein